MNHHTIETFRSQTNIVPSKSNGNLSSRFNYFFISGGRERKKEFFFCLIRCNNCDAVTLTDKRNDISILHLLVLAVLLCHFFFLIIFEIKSKFFRFFSRILERNKRPKKEGEEEKEKNLNLNLVIFFRFSFFFLTAHSFQNSKRKISHKHWLI